MGHQYNKRKSIGFIIPITLFFSLIIIIFSFIAPYLFTKETDLGISFSGTGEIGDTIGGIMNPFIALAGVLLTFLAFYIQYRANKQQRNLFRQELDYNKFENQFYEMLRLHKVNVNEIKLSSPIRMTIGKEDFFYNEESIGREAFKSLLEEIKIIYYVVKKNFSDSKPKEYQLNLAYGIFFNGINHYKRMPRTNDEIKTIVHICDALNYINNGNKIPE